jgi:hypothetical protein
MLAWKSKPFEQQLPSFQRYLATTDLIKGKQPPAARAPALHRRRGRACHWN